MANNSFTQKRSNLIENPFETISDIGKNTLKNTGKAFVDIGSGIINQIIGIKENENYLQKNYNEIAENRRGEKTQKKRLEKKGVVFNYQEYYETTLIKRQIEELTKMIKREIEAIKKSNSSLLNQVKDVEALAINETPEKPGVYHVRFLEIVLNILKSLRAEVGKSITWLQALISRKKKRGSLFAIRSKKLGTQYSLSQELQSARSIQ